MNEKLIELLKEIEKNKELQAKIEEVKTVEELYSITTQYVDGYSLDEFKEGLEYINSQMSTQEDAELSDAELEMVAGGSKSSFHNFIEDFTGAFEGFGETVKRVFSK